MVYSFPFSEPDVVMIPSDSLLPARVEKMKEKEDKREKGKEQIVCRCADKASTVRSTYDSFEKRFLPLGSCIQSLSSFLHGVILSFPPFSLPYLFRIRLCRLYWDVFPPRCPSSFVTALYSRFEFLLRRWRIVEETLTYLVAGVLSRRKYFLRLIL